MVRYTNKSIIIELPASAHGEDHQSLMLAITTSVKELAGEISGPGPDGVDIHYNAVIALVNLLEELIPDHKQLEQIHLNKGKAAA